MTPAELAAAAASLPGSPGVPLALASPWAPPHHLASVVWRDIFGGSYVPMTRAEAMSVPALARARHVLCGFARVPLAAYRAGVKQDTGPAWLTSTSSALPPWHRMLWTLDDLLFYGWSCWARVNGADGKPLRLDRIPPARWAFAPGEDGVTGVTVDNRPVSADQVVMIPGPHEGILEFGQDAVRHAADLQRAAGRAAKHPAAYLAIKQTGGDPLPQRSTDPTVVTIESITDGWAAAREGENGGVAFLTANLEAKELGTFDRHLVLDGRNAAAVDCARLCSLPADLLDAAGPSSFTYANSRDNDKRAVDFGAGLYLFAVSATLSQDSVMVHGQSVAFDLESYLESAAPGDAPAVSPAPAAPLRPVAPARTA